MDKLKMHTPDITEENFQKLSALFPNAVTETINDDGEVVRAIDADVLQQEISATVVEGKKERYQFTWPDKKKSVVLANQPIAKTLRLNREKSVGRDGTPGKIDTENIYIEGDNLDALKLLQETYLGKVKMIYIDPPYNTGSDAFVYDDDFAESAEEFAENSGAVDEDGNRLFDMRVNNESNGRFHTDWLNMMYPRLRLAKDLLADDGVIFISIDDNEQGNLKKICDEIFGSSNFIAQFPRITKKSGKTTENIAKNHDYVLSYSKTKNPRIYLPKHTDEGFKFEDEYINERGKYKLNQTLDYDSLSYSSSLDYPIEIDGKTFYPGQSREKYLDRKSGQHARADWAWRWSKELFDFGYDNGFIVVKGRIYTKTYQNAKIVKKGNKFSIEYFERTKNISSLDFVENEYSNDNAKKGLVKTLDGNVFDYSKPISLLKQLSSYLLNDNDIILDFFSGSATTAHAVMQLNSEDGGNRKFILVQLPETTADKSEAQKAGYDTICDIGEERIRRAGKKIKEETGKDIDYGFRVFTVDSSNMKDIYYNPQELKQEEINLFADNIKEDRTPEDLLFQVMLDLGVLLSSPIEEREIAGKKVFSVDGGYLIACFDTNVTEEVVMAIAKEKPFYAVFRDSSMANDSVMTNFEQIFETYSPNTVRKVL